MVKKTQTSASFRRSGSADRTFFFLMSPTNSLENHSIHIQIYEKIKPTPQIAKNTMHQRAGDNKVIVHHDESSYNATGQYDGGSKTGGQKCCNICPKAEDCVGALK